MQFKKAALFASKAIGFRKNLFFNGVSGLFNLPFLGRLLRNHHENNHSCQTFWHQSINFDSKSVIYLRMWSATSIGREIYAWILGNTLFISQFFPTFSPLYRYTLLMFNHSRKRTSSAVPSPFQHANNTHTLTQHCGCYCCFFNYDSEIA